MCYMKKNAYLLFLVMVLLSCEDNNTSLPDKLDVIQPLGIGFTWNYIDSVFNSEGRFVRVDSSRLGITGSELYQVDDKVIELFYWNWYDFEQQEYVNYAWLWLWLC